MRWDLMPGKNAGMGADQKNNRETLKAWHFKFKSGVLSDESTVVKPFAMGFQARQRAEAAVTAAEQKLERIRSSSSGDHAATSEAPADSTDQGGDEGMMDAEGPAKLPEDHKKVEELQQALGAAQVGFMATHMLLPHQLLNTSCPSVWRTKNF